MNGQMNIFDFIDSEIKPFSIDKPIRLLEIFGGIGATAKALKRLGVDFEHYKLSEWEVHATAIYHKIHMKDDITDYSKDFSDNEIIDKLYNLGISADGKNPMSMTKIKSKGEKWHRRVYNDFIATNNIGSVSNIKGGDLGITDKNKYCYLLTYSFP